VIPGTSTAFPELPISYRAGTVTDSSSQTNRWKFHLICVAFYLLKIYKMSCLVLYRALLRYKQDVPTILLQIFFFYTRRDMGEIQSDGKIKRKMKYCTIGPCKQGPKKITILGIVLCGCEIRFLTLQEGHMTLRTCVCVCVCVCVCDNRDAQPF